MGSRLKWRKRGWSLIRDKELLERHALLQSPSRIEELVKIFIHATKVSSADFAEMQSKEC